MALVFRRNKDVPLTFTELDGNFDDLNSRLVAIEGDYVLSVNEKTGEISLDTDDIPEGYTNQYWTQNRFNSALSAKTTTNLAEGANLYFTESRVLAVIGDTSIDKVSDVDTTSVAPSENQVLTWNGTYWVPATPPGAAGGEANVGVNLGSGTPVYKQKVGVNLELRSLLPGDDNMVINQSATGNEVEISFSPTSTVNFNTQTLTNIGEPSANSDAATKFYVDNHMLDETVEITGAITGTGTFDASGSVVIDTSASDLIVPLGTNTSGDYVDSLVAGNGIALSGGTGEAAVVTISLDTSDSVTFDNMTLSGNLTVNGTTTTLSTANTAIEDVLIELGSGRTGTPSGDTGIILERGDSTNAFFGWDESADRFVVSTTTATGASSGNLTLTPADFEAGIIYVDDLIISGTTITTTTGDLVLAATSNINANSNKITNVSAPTATSDAATKGYVDTELSNYSTDLSITSDNGSSSLPIGNNTFNFDGGTNIATSISGNVITIGVTGTVSSATNATNSTNATYANQIKTVTTSSNADFYPTFVNSNNTTSANETLYTDAGISYNPSTNVLTVSGSISGTSTSAQYADLAENYLADAKYIPGTVLEVGGDAEVTFWNGSAYVAGVVSTDPAFLMNSECQGVPVALVGRVPVRVLGAINKGEAVFADANGVASKKGTGPLVGIALESSGDTEEKLVECMLKV